MDSNSTGRRDSKLLAGLASVKRNSSFVSKSHRKPLFTTLSSLSLMREGAGGRLPLLLS